MTLDQVAGALNSAFNQGVVVADKAVVVKVGGVEKQIAKITLIKGDVTVAPSMAVEETRVLIEIVE
jgi:hypothetical protein